MESFSKYIGVQGVIAMLMVAAWIAAPFFAVVLPDTFSDLMFLVLGFYFAKNGVGIVQALKSAAPK